MAATVMLADTTPAAAAAATSATTPAPAAAAAAAPAKKDADHVVCKSEAVTGSLFPKKTCYSTRDQQQRQAEERQNLEKIQQMSH
jgi:invasion protein IalB